MDPVLFTAFGIEIRWYSILILVGIILAIGMLIKEGKRFNIPKDFLFNMAFWVIIFGIIGARLYYCVFNFNLYKDNLIDILKIWEGGLAIHGGIITGLLVIIIYSWKYKANVFRILDIVVLGLVLGQAIGRWGNFFNMEAFGPKTTLTFLHQLHLPQFVIDGMRINGSYYHPMFLYESIWCLIGFGILMMVRKRNPKIGTQVSTYFLWYGIGRIIIENFRSDSLYLYDFRVSQIVSLILIIIGIIGLLINKSKKIKISKSQVISTNDRI